MFRRILIILIALLIFLMNFWLEEVHAQRPSVVIPPNGLDNSFLTQEQLNRELDRVRDYRAQIPENAITGLCINNIAGGSILLTGEPVEGTNRYLVISFGADGNSMMGSWYPTGATAITVIWSDGKQSMFLRKQTYFCYM